LRHEAMSLRAQLAAAKAAAKPRPPVAESEQVAKLRARIRGLQAELRHVARSPRKTMLARADEVIE